jgi:hypothetical protein
MGWTIRALCAGATTGASSAELPSLNPYGKEAFKTLWGAVRKKLGLAPREITFHDMRAKAASDSDSDESAQELLHHEDVKVTKRVYRRKVPTGTPLPPAIGGRVEGTENGRVCQKPAHLSKPKKNGLRLVSVSRCSIY